MMNIDSNENKNTWLPNELKYSGKKKNPDIIRRPPIIRLARYVCAKNHIEIFSDF
jgi:hypothetical protein